MCACELACHAGCLNSFVHVFVDARKPVFAALGLTAPQTHAIQTCRVSDVDLNCIAAALMLSCSQLWQRVSVLMLKVLTLTVLTQLTG